MIQNLLIQKRSLKKCIFRGRLFESMLGQDYIEQGFSFKKLKQKDWMTKTSAL